MKKNCHRPLFGENKNYYSVVITITCNVVVKIIRKKNGITTMLLLCQENVVNGKQKLPHIYNFVVKMSWKKNRITTMLLLCHENVGNEKQNYYNVITLLWKWWGPIKT